MDESQLKYTIELDENHPESINFQVPGTRINDFVNNDRAGGIFQHFYVYDTGIVICDEVSHGKRYIRSNRNFNLSNNVATFP